MGKNEVGIVLSSGQKDRTLQNGRTEIHGLAVFHELLEQPQDLLSNRRASSCCKAAQVLFCFDYRCLTSKSLRLMCQVLLTISVIACKRLQLSAACGIIKEKRSVVLWQIQPLSMLVLIRD